MLSRKSIKIVANCVAFLLLFILNACSTYYRFTSQPSEADVFYVDGQNKQLIGSTPIEYSKTQLPSDSPFVIRFEKNGYNARDVSVSPSENSLTTVGVMLSKADSANEDEVTKRLRKTLQQIFTIQELTSQRRFADALSAIANLQEREPGLAEAYVLKGSIYILLNDKAQARKEWTHALKLDPSLNKIREGLLTLNGRDS